MDWLKRLEPLALMLMMVGALNWGIVGLFDENLLAEIFGTGTLTDVVYALIGAGALLYVPRMMEELHIGHGFDPNPH